MNSYQQLVEGKSDKELLLDTGSDSQSATQSGKEKNLHPTGTSCGSCINCCFFR